MLKHVQGYDFCVNWDFSLLEQALFFAAEFILREANISHVGRLFPFDIALNGVRRQLVANLIPMGVGVVVDLAEIDCFTDH